MVVPNPKNEPGAWLEVNTAPKQLSLTVGGVQLILAPQVPVAEDALAVILGNKPVMLGLMVSSTVTVNVPVPVLLLASVALNTTELVPKSEQLNPDWLKLRLTIEQLSVEPLLACAVVIEACPLLPRYTVKLLVFTVGAMLSTTVTTTTCVLILLFTSVAVMVTLLAPISEQLKDVLLKVELSTPQLSVIPAEVNT